MLIQMNAKLRYETKCYDCPFSGQDCVYCRNCSVPMLHEKLEERRKHRRRRKLSKLSDVLCLRPANGIRWFVIRAIGR